jgi:hypothetical protein
MRLDDGEESSPASCNDVSGESSGNRPDIMQQYECFNCSGLFDGKDRFECKMLVARQQAGKETQIHHAQSRFT